MILKAKAKNEKSDKYGVDISTLVESGCFPGLLIYEYFYTTIMFLQLP